MWTHKGKRFEYIDYCTDNNYATIRFIVVYRPPTSAGNGLRTSTFFDEWASFIEHLSIDHNNIIIVGDVNFHLDFDSNLDARKFRLRTYRQIMTSCSIGGMMKVTCMLW